jgi:ubiquitin-protein ligase
MALKIIEKQYFVVDSIFNLSKSGDNDYLFYGQFPNNQESRYNGIKLSFILYFPCDYPFSPLILLFDPPLFHPNVDSVGMISLEEFNKKDWCPANSINMSLHTIWSVIDDSILCKSENFASEIWNDIKEYEEILKTYKNDF